jgi:hypothetical protein
MVSQVIKEREKTNTEQIRYKAVKPQLNHENKKTWNEFLGILVSTNTRNIEERIPQLIKNIDLEVSCSWLIVEETPTNKIKSPPIKTKITIITTMPEKFLNSIQPNINNPLDGTNNNLIHKADLWIKIRLTNLTRKISLKIFIKKKYK